MNISAKQYFKAIREQIDAVEQTQAGSIATAAEWVCEALLADHYIYAFGSGHSHVLSEELFYRAGGLARIVPILDGRLMVHQKAAESSTWERKEGLAAEVLLRYSLGKGDVLFIVSNSGRNAVPIEMAMEGLRRGARVVAISSVEYSSAYGSRHSSGKKLTDLAHLVIDNKGVAGDAAVSIPGLKQKVGPGSTISSALILNAIMVGAVALAVEAGGNPEVWGSANSDSTNNDALLAKYVGRIPHL